MNGLSVYIVIIFRPNNTKIKASKCSASICLNIGDVISFIRINDGKLYKIICVRPDLEWNTICNFENQNL